jgi:hypothetical protein
MKFMIIQSRNREVGPGDKIVHIFDAKDFQAAKKEAYDYLTSEGLPCTRDAVDFYSVFPIKVVTDLEGLSSDAIRHVHFVRTVKKEISTRARNL